MTVSDHREKQRALGLLGVDFPGDFAAIQTAPIEHARALLDALKKRVKDSFRRLSKNLHPDVNGGDETKTAEFRLLATVSAEIANLEVQAPPPVIVIFHHPFQGPWGVPVRGVRRSS